MGYSSWGLKKSDTDEHTQDTLQGDLIRGSDLTATLGFSTCFPSALIFLALTPSVDSPLLWKNGHHRPRAHIPQVPLEQKRISACVFAFCSSILANTPLPRVPLGQGSGGTRSSRAWLCPPTHVD